MFNHALWLHRSFCTNLSTCKYFCFQSIVKKASGPIYLKHVLLKMMNIWILCIETAEWRYICRGQGSDSFIFNCSDHLCINFFSSFCSSNIWNSSFFFPGYITNQFSDQLPVCIVAQLVEHCTSIAEVKIRIPVSLNVFRLA